MSQAVFDVLKPHIDAPLTLLDVGGHGGALENWKAFGSKGKIYCFEARSDEAETLTTANQDANIEYVPLGLSDDSRPIDVNVAAAAGCSSAYPPIERIYQRYPGCGIMRPVKRVSCETTTIDDFMRCHNVEAVHGIKLDTQGFELRILKGAEHALQSCQFILIEVEFNPLYEGQPLFGEVDAFLRERGFVLWRLGNLSHYSTGVVSGAESSIMLSVEPGGHQPVAVANGQLFWADAFYVRRAATAAAGDRLDPQDAIAGAALATQWNFDDLAFEMLRKGGHRELLDEARKAAGVSFVAAIPPRFEADQFLSTVLEQTDLGWATDFTHTDQCVVYGPYVRLPAGEFEITYDIHADGLGETLDSVVSFDVAAELASLTSIDLIGPEGSALLKDGGIKLRFFNDAVNARFEFRMSTWGRPFPGKLLFRGVEISRIGEG